jgi:hypothetical protein
VTKRFCDETWLGFGERGPALLVVETTDGAHETALAPVPCAGKIDASVEPSSSCQLSIVSNCSGNLLWKLRTEIFPSLDAQARIGPRS